MADDRHLLLRTHHGHEPSARALWARHAPAMHALAGAIVGEGRTVSADDIVQTVFCRILEQDRKRLRQVEDVRAWLCTATRRTALNSLRSARRDSARRSVRRATVDHASPAQESLDGALQRLPRHVREIIILKHAADMTFDQIALALAMNRNTCASRYRSGVAQLRAWLESGDTPAQEVLHG